MGKKRARPSERTSTPDRPGGGLGGLAEALAAQGLASSGPGAGAPALQAPSADPDLLVGKAVVRQERKGRGGKTVTVIDGSAISRVPELDELARAMRKALGTGARVEGSKLVLQGDQREKAAAWLRGRGARVVIGN